MFCPNCGSKNNKHQTYCRFCRLNLEETAKSLNEQMIFGESSKFLKNLSIVKRISGNILTVLMSVMIVSYILYFFYDQKIGEVLIKTAVIIFFLVLFFQEGIRYLQRREMKKTEPEDLTTADLPQFESKETTKLLEKKSPVSVSSIVEHSTQLFPIENKTRKLD